jgi:MFS family permease
MNEAPMENATPPSLAARGARLGSLRAFRHPDYAKIWTGAFISNIGTWMENIAVGVYVTQTTGKAGWTGTIAALMFLPAVVLAPIGGALADRFDRKRYLMVGTGLQAVLAAALAVLTATHHLSLPVIAILMLATGAASTLVNPAFSALLAELVPPEDLLSALSLSSAQFNLGRVIGPTIAAAVIATGGFATAFFANTLSFLAVMIAILYLRTSTTPEGPKRDLALWSEIRAGFSAVSEDTGIKISVLIIAVTSVLISPFIGLVPAYAIKIFHGGAPQTSVLVASQGVGAVCAALIAGSLAETVGRGQLLGWSVAVIGPLAAFYWMAPKLSVAIPLIVMMGAVYLALITGANTVCLSRVPRRLQARMSSVVSLVLGAGYSLGLVVMGWTGDHVGLRTVGVITGMMFAGFALAMRVRTPGAYAELEGLGHHGVREDATVTVPTLAGPAKIKAE